MNSKSSLHNYIKINPSIKTAIIYSIDEVFSYLVEIKDGEKNYYICDNNNEPIKYGNMESARQAAISKNVQEAYLALSKTYEENDLSTSHFTPDQYSRYDYSPISLYKKD